MNEKFDSRRIREYWTQQARAHGGSSASSWSDQSVIEMEIREIGRRLSDGDRVLDVGCGAGYSTVSLAALRRIRIRGIDYLPEMIENARERLEQLPEALAGCVDFAVGDITRLQEPSGAYDKVLLIRVLINLGDWERQRQALRECIRVLRPGGELLLSEATLQGWRKLNRFRGEWGLPHIPMPAFNHYLDQDCVVEAVGPEMELLEISDFASTYYVATRVLKPLLIRVLRAPTDVADPLMEFNRWFSYLPAWGDYGTQKLFHFRRRVGRRRRDD